MVPDQQTWHREHPPYCKKMIPHTVDVPIECFVREDFEPIPIHPPLRSTKKTQPPCLPLHRSATWGGKLPSDLLGGDDWYESAKRAAVFLWHLESMVSLNVGGRKDGGED